LEGTLQAASTAIAGTEKAKFARPDLAHTVTRERLERALELASRPARWLCAPAGAGKSTLAAQFASRFPRSFWYRLDERDNDPSFLAAHLVELLRAAGLSLREVQSLANPQSRIAGGYPAKLGAAFASCMNAGSIVVLDDVHFVRAPAAVSVLTAVFGHAAHGVTLAVSESYPTAAFYELLADRRLAILSDLDLRLTQEECAQLFAPMGIDATTSARMHTLCEGHAAACAIAGELLRSGASPGDESLDRDLYSHLLSSLLRNLEELDREVLDAAGFLRHFDLALMQSVLPVVDVGSSIVTLTKHGLLGGQSGSGPRQYVAHGLVCRAVRSLVSDSRKTRVAESCAQALEGAARFDEAVELWLELGNVSRALNALERLAPSYAHSRNLELMRRLYCRLPAAELHRRGWLCFWMGQAEHGIDEQAAREWYERAYHAFSRSSEKALAAACVLVAFETSDFTDIRNLVVWIERFSTARRIDAPSLQDPLRCVIALGILANAGLASAEQVDQSEVLSARKEIEAAIELDERWLTRDQQLVAACILINHLEQFDSIENAKHAAIVAERLANDPAASPRARVRYWVSRAWIHAIAREAPNRDFAISRAEQIDAEMPSVSLAFEICEAQTAFALRDDRLSEAEALLGRLEGLAASCRSRQIAHASRLAAGVLLALGRPREALARARAAYEHALRSGYTPAHARRFELELAYALTACGNASEASQRLLTMAELQTGSERDSFEVAGQLLAFVAGGYRDEAFIRSVLRRASESQQYFVLRGLPKELTLICEFALERGIEAPFVRELIKRRGLSPVSGAGSGWPWQFKVQVLGAFRLEIDGIVYRPERKAQERPVELLKLLAVGPLLQSGPLDRRWVAQQLWPDNPIDLAQKSLETTLSRLRRLLGSDDAVLNAAGQIELNEQVVFVDLRRLLWGARMLIEIRDQLVQGVALSDVDLHRALSAISSGWNGVLEGEEDKPWLIAARIRLRDRVRRALFGIEPYLQGTARSLWRSAVHALFELEPTDEEVARVLMAEHHRFDEKALALRVFHDCRSALLGQLGVEPSAQTQDLRQRITEQCVRSPTAAHDKR
jgi:ATP/maltotriose-dependent transcriptional regulator MalT/DNA-binding SARP family transcriptional activator